MIAALLVPAAGAQVAEETVPERAPRSPIRLRVGSFVPTAGETLAIAPELAMDEDLHGSRGYFLVQFQGPIHEEWKAKVSALGGTVLDYVPDFAFVVHMDEAARAAVTQQSEVAWIGPFHPAYTLSPDLAGRTGTLDLMVHTFADQTASAVANELAMLGAAVQDRSERTVGGLLRLAVDASQLNALARLPGVRWIEPFYERVLFNDVARSSTIMDAETVWSDLGLYGAGQIVAVSDTGLDTGSLGSLAQDFLGSPTGCTGTNRIVATYALGRTNDWSDSCRSGSTNYGGHGTHVTGSVLGNGCRSGSGGAPTYVGSYAGLAPQASLVFQSVMGSTCGLSGLPTDLNTLFSQARNAGARIHTNSWGAAVNGQYTTDSENTDEFMRNNRDYTILFAAGNEGADGNSDGFINPDSMSAPGTAKNCITVGGSENYRLSGGYNPGGACSTWGGCWPSDYPANPIYSDRLSDNATGMVAFSSRGPTDDGRLKPDVVAPGSNILSTKSQALYVSGGWGAGPNQYYQYMGGTSMATPLTAGAVALIRDWYTDVKGVTTPSSALLKATVINSAVNMHPGQYGSPLEQQPQLPNSIQGWGRVNVASATDDSHSFYDLADANGLATGASHSYEFVQCTAPAAKITLVWTDYPGSTLVNDLDLTVTAPGGTVYRGNVFSSGWSASGGSADRKNNVESVYLQSPAAGTWTVTVSGYNVPQGTKQGYALVVDLPDNTCAPDFAFGVTPSTLDVCAPGNAVYNASVSPIAGFGNFVTLSTSGRPAGTTESWSQNPVTPPASSVLTIGDTGGAAAGSYAIDVIGTAGALSHKSTVTLNLYTAKPGAAPLTSPADGSTGVALAPAFTWTDVAGETGYGLQLATDPEFANIVHTASLPAGSVAYSGATLNADTLYYWRVGAVNACGTQDSATWAFRTGSVGCTTYASSDVPKTISDGATVYSNLTVADSFSLTDVNLTIGSIVHTYDGDLDIYLEHPDNTAVELSTDNGSSGNNYTSTVFDDEAATAITAGSPPFTGSFKPEGSLAALDGKTSAGTWQLRIYDDSSLDTGTLNAWSLTLCGAVGTTTADYSDLASGYGIAWHTGNGTLRLGTAWDADTAFASGSDDASDDGVAFPNGLGSGGTSIARVMVQGTAANGRWLRLWFDWNGDGVFGDAAGGELVYNASVSDGVNDITVGVPAGQALAPNYRARLYDSAGAPAGGTEARASSSFGGTAGGEVEDGQGPTPTSVDLVRFEAWPEGQAVHVQWETAQEIDNLGFNLYRSNTRTGPKTRLNAELIPTLVPPGSPFGAIYDWIDTYRLRPGRAYFYWLEDVDLYGGTAMHGPVRVRLP
jgi:subtilisin-like proprotein convertase family protein